MKNSIKVFVSVLVIFTLFISCSKDSSNNKNYFKIGETEYALSSGYLRNYGRAVDGGYFQYDGYGIDLTLVSNGIYIITDENGRADLLGSGHVLYFDMYTDSPDGLDERDYNFDSTVPNSVGTFTGYPVNFNDEGGEVLPDFTKGTVSVIRKRKDYEISIDCTDENGKSIIGFYKGTLQYFDYSTKKKSSRKRLKKVQVAYPTSAQQKSIKH
ncbi:hypothetical protein ACFLQ9_00965 [Bacteroidota bacterium]